MNKEKYPVKNIIQTALSEETAFFQFPASYVLFSASKNTERNKNRKK